jgi:hypothetical protein
MPRFLRSLKQWASMVLLGLVTLALFSFLKAYLFSREGIFIREAILRDTERYLVTCFDHKGNKYCLEFAGRLTDKIVKN